MRITPIPHPLNATVRVPGSKSLTNRALLISALANGTTKLTNALFSDDSKYFANALQSLGFDVQLDEADSEMTVTGLGGRIPATGAELFIGNAGTAARFLSAFLTLGNGEYILDGDARMRERPIGDLANALEQLGCDIQPLQKVESRKQICPPVKISASGLKGGKTKIAGDISSQFLSALLMVAPYAKSPIEIELTTELNSKPYVDMTIAMMKDFGVEMNRNGYQSFTVPLSTYQSPIPSLKSPVSSLQFSNSPILQSPISTYQLPITTYPIESDASAASYFFAAPAISGGMVKVENISRNSVQGDIKFLDVLTRMGCVIAEEDNSLLVTCNSQPKGLDVDMRDIPDTAQTLAAIAPFASTPTRIRGIASARHKETDRVHATCAELARLGVQVDEHEDGMTIYPCKNFQPATIQTHNDHRMAMAFSLIGLCFDGVTIENPSCVSKTFPNFFDVLETLR
ncbi:MAG TPA: 3-phosphoshikimate 1-carboxyvinyltransferase [Anaerolineales bacterium]|nr:3-phosphoshikimate 1-carboxyvinyltransferase [Anaerolineales bacterium]HNQ96365.1 3-phosphoshikimate 1-carboxyvinyltransferase [Anaerolineales bacterium]HNS61875.1 3-phosphoshikimate 1-carboxyvinyltransferase [Anaerolineales bacterium]